MDLLGPMSCLILILFRPHSCSHAKFVNATFHGVGGWARRLQLGRGILNPLLPCKSLTCNGSSQTCASKFASASMRRERWQRGFCSQGQDQVSAKPSTSHGFQLCPLPAQLPSPFLPPPVFHPMSTGYMPSDLHTVGAPFRDRCWLSGTERKTGPLTLVLPLASC